MLRLRQSPSFAARQAERREINERRQAILMVRLGLTRRLKSLVDSADVAYSIADWDRFDRLRVEIEKTIHELRKQDAQLDKLEALDPSGRPTVQAQPFPPRDELKPRRSTRPNRTE